MVGRFGLGSTGCQSSGVYTTSCTYVGSNSKLAKTGGRFNGQGRMAARVERFALDLGCILNKGKGKERE